MHSKIENLLQLAKTIELPSWATHVAIRKDGSKIEPCAWIEKANDYIDEDPSTLDDGVWCAGYKQCYWAFYSRAELDTTL